MHLRAFIPTCEAFGWEGGPSQKTRIIEMANKRERRNAEWDQPRHFFSVGFSNIKPADYAPIKQMHLACRGGLHAFLYRDRLDSSANNELLAVAQAGQQEFQMVKTSVVDSVVYQRFIYALYEPNPSNPGQAIASDPVVSVDGVVSTGFTFDHDRGIAIADSPMSGGEVLRWSGKFALWVRFDNDRLPFSIDNKSGGEFIINGSVELVEVDAPIEEGSD